MRELDAQRFDARSLGRGLRAGADEAAAAATETFAERAARAGLLDVAYATADTPVGTAILAATPRGLVRLALPGESPDRVLSELASRVSPRVIEWRARLDQTLRELDEYFAGHRQRFEVSLDWRLTRAPFSRSVLRRTARIPFGSTSTYSEVAAEAGHPRAYRAAGNALGSNPIPIVVPCHRVLPAGGGIGNYGGGPAMKEYLLRFEGAIR
jgi:methylated-DNA-[protein]-cysteine S-methyltransferase